MRAARAISGVRGYGTGAWLGYSQPRTVRTTTPGQQRPPASNSRSLSSTTRSNSARPKAGVAALLSYCPAGVPKWAKDRPTPQKAHKALHKRHAERRREEVAANNKRRADAHQAKQLHKQSEESKRHAEIAQRRKVLALLAQQRRSDRDQDHANIRQDKASRQQRRSNLHQAERSHSVAKEVASKRDQEIRRMRVQEQVSERREAMAAENAVRHSQIAAAHSARVANLAQDKHNKTSQHPQTLLETAQQRQNKQLQQLASKIGMASARELVALRAKVAANKQRDDTAQGKPARAVCINPDKVLDREANDAHRKRQQDEIAARRQKKVELVKQRAAWAQEDDVNRGKAVQAQKQRRIALAQEARGVRGERNQHRMGYVAGKKEARAAAVQDKRKFDRERHEAYAAERGQYLKYRANVVADEKDFVQGRQNAETNRKAFAKLYRAQAFQAEKEFQKQHHEGHHKMIRAKNEYRAQDYAFRKAHGKSHPILKNQLLSGPSGVPKSAARRTANKPASRAVQQRVADIASVRGLPDF